LFGAADKSRSPQTAGAQIHWPQATGARAVWLCSFQKLKSHGKKTRQNLPISTRFLYFECSVDILALLIAPMADAKGPIEYSDNKKRPQMRHFRRFYDTRKKCRRHQSAQHHAKTAHSRDTNAASVLAFDCLAPWKNYETKKARKKRAQAHAAWCGGQKKDETQKARTRKLCGN
jgi:hypothetical protein